MSKPLNSFPGYEFIPPEHPGDSGKNMYRGVDLGFGGYVYAEPGMYRNVALLDAASMHPTSIVMLNKLGKYTETYNDIRKARVFIKHHDYESAAKLFDGKLSKYLESDETADQLSQALKLPLNAFYGISFSKKYKTPARDSRDVNNIIALRGALFIKTLSDEVVSRGFKVVHCKTDSIKIPEATDEIIQFVIDFGKKYGYDMEHEATYDRMCLVNNSTYIAKYDKYGVRNKGGKKANQWTATAAQFAQPYVFKTLFSKEPITFEDKCETKNVKTAIYLDMNEDLPEGEHNYMFVGKTGLFCPIKEGCGGGVMLRMNGEKYDAVTGTKGYRWLETETVKNLNKQNDIDESYYRKLVDDAIDAMSIYGNVEEFIYS